MLWKERGASLFTHFTPFFCTFFLSKSPHLFSYKAFSFFQQALRNFLIFSSVNGRGGAISENTQCARTRINLTTDLGHSAGIGSVLSP